MVHNKILKEDKKLADEIGKDLDKLKTKNPEAYNHAETVLKHQHTMLKHGHTILHKLANR